MSLVKNIFLLTGKLHLMSKTTKIDKSIDAHEGNVTVGKWSPDGSTLLTGQYLCIIIH